MFVQRIYLQHSENLKVLKIETCIWIVTYFYNQLALVANLGTFQVMESSYSTMLHCIYNYRQITLPRHVVMLECIILVKT